MLEMESGQSLGERLVWGRDFNRLLTLIDTHQIDEKNYRFFVGYSGWSPGQLMEELNAKSWIVTKTRMKTSFLIFHLKICGRKF